MDDIIDMNLQLEKHTADYMLDFLSMIESAGTDIRIQEFCLQYRLAHRRSMKQEKPKPIEWGGRGVLDCPEIT